MAEIDFNSIQIKSGNEMLPIGTVVLVELVHQAVKIEKWELLFSL